VSLTSIVRSRPFIATRILTLALLLGVVVAEATLYEDEAKVFVIPMVLIALCVNIPPALADTTERRRSAKHI
jgi:hypothetical protein